MGVLTQEQPQRDTGCSLDKRMSANKRSHTFLCTSLTYSWARGGGQLSAEGKGVFVQHPSFHVGHPRAKLPFD